MTEERQTEHAPARRVRRRTLVIGAAVVGVLALAGGGIAVTLAMQAQAQQAEQAAAAAAAEFAEERAAAVAAVDAARDALGAANDAVADSEEMGRDTESRAALVEQIAEFEPLLAAAESELAENTEPARADAANAELALVGGVDERDAAAFPAATALPPVTEDLVAATEELTAAIEKWRALAESSVHTEFVYAKGWYPELDECKGSVDLTERYAGVPTIAEHWSCGGKDFPDEPGTIVTLTGEHEGIYRVEGIVAMLDSNRHGVGDLPRGHDLLYQTCQDGWSWQMSFTALTRIE